MCDSLVSIAVQTVLKSLDDPKTAGLILEEQANALKSILGDPSVLKLVRVNVTFSFCLCYMSACLHVMSREEVKHYINKPGRFF